MREIFGSLWSWLIGLVGLVAVVAVGYMAYAANKDSTAIADVNTLAAQIQNLYANNSAFTTLTNAIAVNGKLAPNDMINGTTLTNPWGGTVTVNVNAGSAQQFDVTETLIPQASCGKMIGALNNIVGLKINGTTATLPMDPGTAVATCTAANTLIFTFGH